MKVINANSVELIKMQILILCTMEFFVIQLLTQRQRLASCTQPWNFTVFNDGYCQIAVKSLNVMESQKIILTLLEYTLITPHLPDLSSCSFSFFTMAVLLAGNRQNLLLQYFKLSFYNQIYKNHRDSCTVIWKWTITMHIQVFLRCSSRLIIL